MDLTDKEKLMEARLYIGRQNEYIDRLEEALNKIATRKMSMYLSTSHMSQDFIKIANEALGRNDIESKD